MRSIYVKLNDMDIKALKEILMWHLYFCENNKHVMQGDIRFAPIGKAWDECIKANAEINRKVESAISAVKEIG